MSRDGHVHTLRGLDLFACSNTFPPSVHVRVLRQRVSSIYERYEMPNFGRYRTYVKSIFCQSQSLSRPLIRNNSSHRKEKCNMEHMTPSYLGLRHVSSSPVCISTIHEHDLTKSIHNRFLSGIQRSDGVMTQSVNHCPVVGRQIAPSARGFSGKLLQKSNQRYFEYTHKKRLEENRAID